LLTGYFREKRRRREEVGKAAQMVKIPGLRWETKAIKKEAPPRTGAAAHCAHGDGNWSRDARLFADTLRSAPRERFAPGYESGSRVRRTTIAPASVLSKLPSVH